MKENKILCYILRFIIYLTWRIERIINYFKKDVWVQVDYINGPESKEPDSFNIYIIQRGRAESLWGKIDWNEHGRLIEVLKKSKKHVQLEMRVGMGTTTLFIPKWAKSKIVKELEKINEKKELTHEQK